MYTLFGQFVGVPVVSRYTIWTPHKNTPNNTSFHREYVRKGNKKDFEVLKLNFEGLERLKLWMQKHAWLKKLLDANIVALMEGIHVQNTVRNSDSHSLRKMIKTFLRTGREEDFKKILRRTVELSQAFLDTHSQYLYNLRYSEKI